ncbi:DUF4760 domain-containing protein [Pseudomonas sediminis]|uniref:DUF4760 domain-containing protein n=1 Tax=Pseudomonas sediminis TaxID=1691904 RepID=A0ABX6SPR1_9PSED|nr:hypothetical protein [Pseudomonas sediminis]QNH03052.1 hypothetical protein HNQ25_10105 [Pseudomonas sediminis]
MEEIKEVLNIFYLLSGPALVFIAYKALAQIKVTKEIAKTNARRESLILTAKECRYYAQNIIPLCNAFNETLERVDAKFFTESKTKIENNNIKVQYHFDKDSSELFPGELDDIVTSLINSLSDFSNFFTSGVADEKVAYENLGYTFCNTVKKLAPLLVKIAEQHNEDNILKLFMIWHNRREMELAIKEKNALEEKINKSKSVSIDVLGA